MMMEFESKSMLSGMVMAVLLAIALADTSTSKARATSFFKALLGLFCLVLTNKIKP